MIGPSVIAALKSPVTRWIGGVLIAVALALGWHNERVDRAVSETRRELRAEFKAATEAELARQQAVMETVIRKAEARAAAARAVLEEKKDQADAIVDELRQSPPGGCRMSPDLLRRLRELR